MTILSFLNLCYLATEKPDLRPLQNKFDIFGETVVYINIWTSMIFQMAITTKSRNILGYVHIATTASVVAVGILNICVSIPRNIKYSFVRLMQHKKNY
jgi:hypothetical protein